MASNNVEEYWSEVAVQLARRDQEGKVIAGDNDIFYVYKRKVYLQKISGIIDWESKKILEYGCGPGGNLEFLTNLRVKSLVGIDISNDMLILARKNTKGLETEVELIHNNGKSIPLEDNYVDVVFTSTVLQHNIDDETVEIIIGELCRVSSDVVILCEHTEPKRKIQHDHFVGRTLEFYKDRVCKNGYRFEMAEYMDIQVSYYVLGAIRKLFNSKNRKEGEPLSPLSLKLQKMAFGFTRLLDRWVPASRDLTIMVFRKTSEHRNSGSEPVP